MASGGLKSNFALASNYTDRKIRQPLSKSVQSNVSVKIIRDEIMRQRSENDKTETWG